ncbi:hypothetical protein FKO01_63850 [Mesorhizobium sp. B2-3-3]|nr:hypothetical protein FKO01_63850 [Mesorhizobium sp. B2-3-3]
MTETPADEYRQAAAELRDLAPMIDGPLAGLADPVADWLDQAAKHHDATVIGAASVWRRPDEAAYRDAFVTKHTDRAALAVARQLLGATTGQPATAPWPPTGVERPDHKLYTLLRRTGLTPEAAQQEIDTYTQTILARQTAPAVDRAAVLNEAADEVEADARARHNRSYSDNRIFEWKGARAAAARLRRLAAEAQQPTPAETEEQPDTLAPWLYQRFMVGGAGWDHLDEEDRSYWEHHARAVRRAVVRGGFKAPAVTEEPTPCGNTQGLGTRNPYRPCARPAGHPEAYCKDATGDHLFLPATHATEEPK